MNFYQMIKRMKKKLSDFFPELIYSFYQSFNLYANFTALR